jgi:signal transduction histidine kinase
LLAEGPFGEARVVEEGLGEDFRPLEPRLREGKLPLCCRDAVKRHEVITREPFTCGDCPLSERHQPKEVMTVQLGHEGKSFGFVCVSMPSAFTELKEEQRLFQDVATDIAFALNKLVLERDRAQAVQRRIALSRKILAAQEEERARVSRELHDELGQILTALHFELDLLGQPQTAAAGGLADGLRKADQVVVEAISELRRICRGLRPPLLDDLGVVPAMKSLVAEFESRIGIAVRMETDVDEDRRVIPTENAVCAFRVLQEALNNIARHSGAEHVTICLTEEGHDLVLQVQDDGRGFDLDGPEVVRGYGLQGMRERADLVDGALEVWSAPRQGTRITLRVAKEPPAGGER